MSVLPLLILLSIGIADDAHADYALPDSMFGYHMSLSNHAEQGEETMFIGFVQYEGTPAPFVIIETFSNNLFNAKITTQIVEHKVHGKIHLPAGVMGSDVKQLRINGYTVLWKHLE